MSLLTQTCTITIYLPTVTGSGLVSPASAGTETHACSWQPDSSAEVVALNIQQGRETGRLYVGANVEISQRETVAINEVEYRVAGPAVLAPGAPYKWVPLVREWGL